MTRIVSVTWASDMDPYPPNITPYPEPGTYSDKLGLQVFDLITPDGDRVWVVAGWEERSGNLRAWTIVDFVAGRRRPGKFVHDDPRSFAPLTRVNANAETRESFIQDYVAAENGPLHKQDFLFGMPAPSAASDWIYKKIHPYKGFEHIVRDSDTFFRSLIVDPVRAGKPKHYKAVDIWEVTASWHVAHQSRRPPPESKSPTADGQFLYRLYNHAGALLYIGITDNVFRRWKEHSKDKGWWNEVHKFTQDWYPDRVAVEAAERHAIAAEKPLYNVIGATR